MVCTVRRLVVLAFVCGGLSACGGGGSTPTAPTTPTTPTPNNQPAENRAPVISSFAVTPAFGIADLQDFSFKVAASDPDGDALSYRWEFGYAADASVTNNSAVMQGRYSGGTGGPVTITVTAIDAKGATATATASIVLGTMNGGWTLTDGGNLKGGLFQLQQSASGAVVGEYGLPGAGGTDFITDAQPGHITTGAAVTLPVRIGSRVVTLTGTMDTTGRRIAGTMDGPGVSGVPFVLVKD
jgi:hypothetical protein